jgi:hypothetical protein
LQCAYNARKGKHQVSGKKVTDEMVGKKHVDEGLRVPVNPSGYGLGVDKGEALVREYGGAKGVTLICFIKHGSKVTAVVEADAYVNKPLRRVIAALKEAIHGIFAAAQRAVRSAVWYSKKEVAYVIDLARLGNPETVKALILPSVRGISAVHIQMGGAPEVGDAGSVKETVVTDIARRLVGSLPILSLIALMKRPAAAAS